jgi:hypothetical protein
MVSMTRDYPKNGVLGHVDLEVAEKPDIAGATEFTSGLPDHNPGNLDYFTRS